MAIIFSSLGSSGTWLWVAFGCLAMIEYPDSYLIYCMAMHMVSCSCGTHAHMRYIYDSCGCVCVPVYISVIYQPYIYSPGEIQVLLYMCYIA